MSKSPTLDAAQVQHAITNLIAAYPELAEDETLRADMIEGATDAFEVLDRIVSAAQDAAAMQAGIATLIEGYRARKDAAGRREEAMRTLALRIMEAADLRKVTLPRATLSVRPTPPSVRVTDEASIPDRFWKVERKLDKAAIKAALQDDSGLPVPGAELSNGGASISIRVA